MDNGLTSSLMGWSDFYILIPRKIKQIRDLQSIPSVKLGFGGFSLLKLKVISVTS